MIDIWAIYILYIIYTFMLYIIYLYYVNMCLYVTHLPNQPTLHAVLLFTDTHAKFSSWYEATAIRIVFAPNLKHTKAIYLTRSSLMEGLFPLTVQESTVHHSGEGLAVGTQSSWSHYIHSQEREGQNVRPGSETSRSRPSDPLPPVRLYLLNNVTIRDQDT